LLSAVGETLKVAVTVSPVTAPLFWSECLATWKKKKKKKQKEKIKNTPQKEEKIKKTPAARPFGLLSKVHH